MNISVDFFPYATGVLRDGTEWLTMNISLDFFPYATGVLRDGTEWLTMNISLDFVFCPFFCFFFSSLSNVLLINGWNG